VNLITTEQAAERIFTTAYTIRKYIRQGRLLAAKIGKQYLIREEDLNQFFESLLGKPEKQGIQ